MQTSQPAPGAPRKRQGESGRSAVTHPAALPSISDGCRMSGSPGMALPLLLLVLLLRHSHRSSRAADATTAPARRGQRAEDPEAPACSDRWCLHVHDINVKRQTPILVLHTGVALSSKIERRVLLRQEHRGEAKLVTVHSHMEALHSRVSPTADILVPGRLRAFGSYDGASTAS